VQLVFTWSDDMTKLVELIPMELYKKIKQARDSAGLTQTEVADSLTRAGYSITPQAVQLWETPRENGGTTPRGFDKRTFLAELFGSDYNNLFLGGNNEAQAVEQIDTDLLKKCLVGVLNASLELDEPISVETLVDYALELYTDPDDLSKPKKIKRFLNMMYQQQLT